MDPSSLIFVVIVAIWAVYLLGHWVRRRDMLATARSVDRFSEAMRVLERRVPQPVGAPRSRSYVVAPSRLPAREVTGRVAFDTDASGTPTGGRAAPVSDAGPSAVAGARPGSSAPAGSAVRPQPGASESSRSAAAGARPGSAGNGPRGSAAPGRSAVGRPEGRASRRPDAAANRARALVLLGLLMLAPAGWLATALTSLPAWVPTVLTVALVVHVAHLRRIAMRRRALTRRRMRPSRGAGGRAARRMRHQASESHEATGRPARHQAHPRPRRSSAGHSDPLADGTPSTGSGERKTSGTESTDSGDSANSAGEPRPAGTEVAGATPASTEQPIAATAPVEPEADGAAPPGDGSAIAAAAGSGWQPVPVPPPTYTLKPKAPAPVQRSVISSGAAERQPARAATYAAPSRPASGSAASPASGQASDDAAPGPDGGFDLDQILERRIVAGG